MPRVTQSEALRVNLDISCDFELVVVAIVLLSIVPMVIEVIKERKAHKTAG